MKALRIVTVLIIISFLGCNSETPVQEGNVFPNPPAQKGEIDLVGFSGQFIEAVAVNPQQPWNIIVSAGSPIRKVFVSRDYGNNWNVTLDSIRSRCIVWDHKNPSVAYLAKNAGMIFENFLSPFLLKTNDYGKSWTGIDSNIYLMDKHITTIAIDYFDPNYIYLVATANKYDMPSGLAADGRLYSSSNGGRSFTDSIDLSMYYSFGDYVLVQDFATSNLYSGVLFAAIISDFDDNDLAISSDFGNTWVAKNIVDNWYSDLIRIYNEMVVLKVINIPLANKDFDFIIDSSRVLISSDFGLSFKMVDPNTLDYSKVNDLLLTPEGYIVFTAHLKSDPSKCVIYISRDRGQTWSKLTSDTDRKTFLAYDFKNKFLYFVKNKENKGLYRIKLQ
ncbi:MAG: hypothetical protein HPY57_04285 [Ignavibacteria bacterium]|nr:hypothetical protein [Ignavibacteria bacterium]